MGNSESAPKYTALVIAYEGTEEIAKNEVEKILGRNVDSKIDSKAEPSVVFFNAQREELFKLGYLGQSFVNVIELITSSKIEELSDFKFVEKIDFSFVKGKRFRITCNRIGGHDFSANDVEREIGRFVHGGDVDLDNPQVVIYVYAYSNMCYLGIDYNNIDLSKRDYNLHPHSKSIKGTVAYSMLMIGGYEKGKVLLDPFCLSGAVAIEAGYCSTGFSINYFRKSKFLFVKEKLVGDAFFKGIDIAIPKEFGNIYAYDYEMRNISAAKHNAKIGEIDKVIEFRKVESEWIDLKFGEGDLDLIVSSPPDPTASTERQIRPRIKELFYNADYVLKKGGKLVIKGNDLVREEGEKSKLKFIEQVDIVKGSNVIEIFVYEL